MGRNPKHLLPQMGLHKGSGHARVRIHGIEHWLGPFGSLEAQAAYDRLIAQYLANRGAGQSPVEPSVPAAESAAQPEPPPPVQAPAPEPTRPALTMEVTVAEVCVMYLEFAKTHYRLPDGRLSSSYDGMVQAVSALQKHRQLPATAFGPRCLRQVVEQLTQEKSRNGKPRPPSTCIVHGRMAL